ncbi:conserved membrane hypothetical protein [Arthrobacter sp. 9AX]|uniref:hypothetical protein n=1 Tax=Arthrobacter sp. 9AX TaxID=2653131 RepID=UPI0012F4458A|nr:hypothetical protein [Arthrobacter sp. 9AX]VXB20771.1 conserved membrane hypothetical protein [Arthrobacter sp. 9AX]
MQYLRWIFSFVGFPLGGWVAFLLVGSANSPLAAAAAGAIAGTAIGAAQWLALRPAVSPAWIAAGTGGMGLGSAAAALTTGSTTTVPGLALTGAIAGAAVGLGQGMVFRRGWRVAALWAVTVSGAWALGWVVTANVIVDADSGYVCFGSSGALVVTAITGLVLHRLLGCRGTVAVSPAADAAAAGAQR